MAYIPEDKLLEIKDAASIEEVVGQYVKLERRGRNFVGLCPFHPDSKPSFTVSPEKGIYYCFGCQAGGNVISFVMQYHKLSFVEAVSELARRYGITLSLKDMGPEAGRRAKKREVLLEISQEALKFYRACLEGRDGGAAREYLARRRISPEISRLYQLGYAPAEWDGLRKHLQQRGLPLEAAAEAGLLIPRPSGGYYDRFRDRVMFPIFDRQERVVAFGGRIIGEGEPKYLNSPESPLYTKGRLLYGLPQAREAMRREDLALVVEGYLDLLSLREHGVLPVAACLGTALTREQVRLLKNLVSRVVLVFDGDAAGARAMVRAFPLCAQEGLAVRVIALPAGLDPDTYVQTHGPELFAAPWDAARPWFVYLLEGLVATHGLSIEGKVKVAEELRPYLEALAEPVEQGLWLKYAAEHLGVAEADLRAGLSQPAAVRSRRWEAGSGLAINLEKGVVRWVLNHPEAVPAEELTVWAQEFDDPELKEVMQLVAELCARPGGLDLGLLLARLDDEGQRRQICALALGEGETAQSSEALAAEDWRRAFRRRHLLRAREAVKERLTRAALQQGEEDLLALLAQRQELDRQLEELKAPTGLEGGNG
jgi:DNA primase